MDHRDHLTSGVLRKRCYLDSTSTDKTAPGKTSVTQHRLSRGDSSTQYTQQQSRCSYEATSLTHQHSFFDQSQEALHPATLSCADTEKQDRQCTDLGFAQVEFFQKAIQDTSIGLTMHQTPNNNQQQFQDGKRNYKNTYRCRKNRFKLRERYLHLLDLQRRSKTHFHLPYQQADVLEALRKFTSNFWGPFFDPQYTVFDCTYKPKSINDVAPRYQDLKSLRSLTILRNAEHQHRQVIQKAQLEALPWANPLEWMLNPPTRQSGKPENKEQEIDFRQRLRQDMEAFLAYREQVVPVPLTTEQIYQGLVEQVQAIELQQCALRNQASAIKLTREVIREQVNHQELRKGIIALKQFRDRVNKIQAYSKHTAKAKQFPWLEFPNPGLQDMFKGTCLAICQKMLTDISNLRSRFIRSFFLHKNESWDDLEVDLRHVLSEEDISKYKFIQRELVSHIQCYDSRFKKERKKRQEDLEPKYIERLYSDLRMWTCILDGLHRIGDKLSLWNPGDSLSLWNLGGIKVIFIDHMLGKWCIDKKVTEVEAKEKRAKNNKEQDQQQNTAKRPTKPPKPKVYVKHVGDETISDIQEFEQLLALVSEPHTSVCMTRKEQANAFSTEELRNRSNLLAQLERSQTFPSLQLLGITTEKVVRRLAELNTVGFLVRYAGGETEWYD